VGFGQAFGYTAHAVAQWFGEVLFRVWLRLSVAIATPTRELRVSPTFFFFVAHAQGAFRGPALTALTVRSSAFGSGSIWLSVLRQPAHCLACARCSRDRTGGLSVHGRPAHQPLPCAFMFGYTGLGCFAAHKTNKGRVHMHAKHLFMFSGQGHSHALPSRPWLTGRSTWTIMLRIIAS
jgi:hypothetical protein